MPPSRRVVVGQLIRWLPPISATILGKRVAVMSRFMECRRLPPNSTANGRIERGTKRADQVPGMRVFSIALYGATTLRLCISSPANCEHAICQKRPDRMVELHARMKQLHGIDHGKPVSLAPAVAHAADVRGRRATAQLYARGR